MNAKLDYEAKVVTETVTNSRFKQFAKKIPFTRRVIENLNQQYERDKFVVSELRSIDT